MLVMRCANKPPVQDSAAASCGSAHLQIEIHDFFEVLPLRGKNAFFQFVFDFPGKFVNSPLGILGIRGLSLKMDLDLAAVGENGSLDVRVLRVDGRDAGHRARIPEPWPSSRRVWQHVNRCGTNARSRSMHCSSNIGFNSCGGPGKRMTIRAFPLHSVGNHCPGALPFPFLLQQLGAVEHVGLLGIVFR